MELYVICALSFALMFYWRYTREAIIVFREVAAIHNEEINEFSPIIYSLAMFLYITFTMPYTFYLIIRYDRMEVVKQMVYPLLEQYCGLEKK